MKNILFRFSLLLGTFIVTALMCYGLGLIVNSLVMSIAVALFHNLTSFITDNYTKLWLLSSLLPFIIFMFLCWFDKPKISEILRSKKLKETENA